MNNHSCTLKDFFLAPVVRMHHLETSEHQRFQFSKRRENSTDPKPFADHQRSRRQHNTLRIWKKSEWENLEHAKDYSVNFLQLFSSAIRNRNRTKSVTMYNSFDDRVGYDHFYLYESPLFFPVLSEFLSEVTKFDLRNSVYS